MKFGTYAFLQYNKGNLLYYAKATKLTMDYLPNALEDGLVGSASSYGVVSITVN